MKTWNSYECMVLQVRWVLDEGEGRMVDSAQSAAEKKLAHTLRNIGGEKQEEAQDGLVVALSVATYFCGLVSVVIS